MICALVSEARATNTRLSITSDRLICPVDLHRIVVTALQPNESFDAVLTVTTTKIAEIAEATTTIIIKRNNVTGTENQLRRTHYGGIDLQSFSQPTAQIDRTELRSENGRHR